MTAEERKAEAIRKMYLAAVEVLQIEGLEISNKTIAHSLFSAGTAMIIAHCKQEELIPDEERLWFKDFVRVPLGDGYDCEGDFFFYKLETVFDECGVITLDDESPSCKTHSTTRRYEVEDDLYISEDELDELPPLITPDYNPKK